MGAIIALLDSDTEWHEQCVENLRTLRLTRRVELATVFSVDDDFLVYRIEGRKRFFVLPRR